MSDSGVWVQGLGFPAFAFIGTEPRHSTLMGTLPETLS